MAPNETKKGRSGFFSGMFGGRKRAAAVNSNNDEHSTKKRLKPSTPTRQERTSTTPTKRSSVTKLVISEEWDESSEDEEEQAPVVLPQKSTTPTKRKKRLPPSKLYPVKIAQTKATSDSSDSEDTFATANDASPKKKAATPVTTSSSVNNDNENEIPKETSTTPETFSTDSQDDSSGKDDHAQRQAVSKMDEPGLTRKSHETTDKNEHAQEKATPLAKTSESSPSTSSSSSSSDDDSSNDEAETALARNKRLSAASASDSSSSSSDDGSSSSSGSSSDSEEDSQDKCSSQQARLPMATKKRNSEPLKTVDIRDCSQQTVLTSNTKKRARRETVAEEEEEECDIPTTETFQKSCWKCRATLKLENGEVCLYAMHIHPLFKVPICSVCADDVLGVELDSAGADDPTQCSGCGLDEEDVETLLLCDACPRAFCETCVACSHGGGVQGMKQVELLSNANDDEKWSCPFCKPPQPLQSLQSFMERIGDEKESKERTMETILSELEKVEAERKECEYQMSPEVLAEKNKEVGAELRMSMKLVPMEEIDDAVEEEMEDWKLEWAKHDQRLSDRVVSLQEEIEMRGENLAGCYAAILGETKVDSNEPDWKKAADAEIQRRKDEEEDADDISLQNPSHPFVYKKDIPEDIEDLGISDPGENENKRSVWRSGRRRAKAKDMQEALKIEDKMLQQRDIPVLRVVDDTEDVEEVKEEEVLISGRADDGASRIRRDGYQLIVCQRAERARRTRTERPKKKHRASTSVTRNARGSNRQDSFDASGDVSDLSDNDSVAMPSTSDGTFDNSALVLSSPEQIRQEDEPNHSVRTVAIASSLASKLKAHQVSGVEFMWKQCFADLAYPDPPADVLERVGGCILAHNMGLGKSLTCISLLHALLKHPSLVSRTPEKERQRPIRTVLLVVPTNVIAHWKAEIDQWTGQLASPIPVFNLGALHPSARPYEIKQWKQKGGILLISLSTFSSLVKKSTDDEALLDPGPDVIVADEAHLMLKKSTNNIFNALAGVKTRRRIVLTGSPFQNNLLEYYRLVSWARPGILGNSESTFEKEYGDPIMNGLSSDASPYAVRVSHEKSKKLNQLIGPFMQRRDVSTLRKELPPIQEVVLHVRQSRTQSRLYRAFASYKKRKNITNFFKNWQMIRPLHNHPGTLLLKEQKEKKNGGTRDSPDEKSAAMEVEPEIVEISTDTEEEAELLETASTSTVADDGKGFEENVSPLDANGADKSADASKVGKKAPSGRTDPVDTENWWQKTVDRHGGVDKMNEVEQGYKIVLLLHILVEAQAIGDKVLVFSQCLRTLDFLEHVLGLGDWTKHVPSLSSSLPATGKRGGWVKGRDYLRIDGETNFSDRGDLIARFNDGKSSPCQGMKSGGVDEVKAFFLSSMACGIGINLVAANRVVLFDNHFNPTIMTQALYRSYRYGQTKPVFAYRFMTEGSVEEKIYSRSVNKTGVSLRVIDNKSIARNFTEKELQDLEETDTWVQCDSCEKWRMLPRDIDEEDLPKEWYCEMNEHDEVNASCDASEKDRAWYYRHVLTGQVNIEAASPTKGIKPPVAANSSLSLDDENSKLEKDVILKKLLTVTASDQQSSVISKHYFHNDLLAETEEKLMDDEAFAAVTAAVGESANGDNLSSTKAPPEVPVSTQPTRVSLCESVDKIFQQSPSSTSIGAIMNSLQAEYGVKFDKSTKAFVRKRLKELLCEKLEESTTNNGDDEPSTTTSVAKPPPPAEEDSVETAESKAKTPPCTPRKKMPTSASRSCSGTSPKKAATSPPDPSPTHKTASSAHASPLNYASPLKKSRDRPSRKKSDSPPPAEKEEQGPLSPPRGVKSPENEDPSSPHREESPESEDPSSSSAAQVASLPVDVESPGAKPSGRKDGKQSHPNPPEDEEEKEQEPISPHRARRSLESASSPRQASALPEVIEILSDSDDAADAAVVEDVVEILD